MSEVEYQQIKRDTVISTDSGPVRGSKSSPYIQWLRGWKDAGGWTGHATVRAAWNNARKDGKPSECSWYAYGYLMSREQCRGRALAEDEYRAEGYLPW